MLVHIVIFCILSSGSIFAAAYMNKRYEVTLPLYLIIIIIVLFLSGLLGSLISGFAITILISCSLLAISLFIVMKHKCYYATLRNLMTPGAIIFVIAFVAFTWLDYGRMSSTYDEFTHWADSVKVMVLWDDFVTNPEARAMFPNYPPGEALIQYFVQKLYLLLEPSSVFSEWRLYFTRHIFFVALVLPFFSGFTWKDSLYAMLSSISIVILPLFLYNDYHSSFYSSLYIDGFLGVCAGVGFALVIFWKHKDYLYRLYVLLIIALLVLLKQSGIIFAVSLAFIFALDELIIVNADVRRKRCLLSSMAASLAVIIPYLAWYIKAILTKADSVFQPTLSLTRVVNIVFQQNYSYIVDIWKGYLHAFFTRSIAVGSTSTSVSYPVLLIILFVVLVAIITVRHRNEAKRKALMRLHVITTIVLCLVYIVGLAILYLVQFSREEALGLASFDRYQRVIYITILMLSMLGVVIIIQNTTGRRWIILLLCMMLVAIATPWHSVNSLITRKSVKSSIAWRTPLNTFCDDLKKIQGETPAEVFIISQETTGNEFLAMRYYLRPYNTNPWGTWSICKPDTIKNEWIQTSIGADEWAADIFTNYDYVLLLKVNDEFVESYSKLFSDPNRIRDRTIFYVDKPSTILNAI